jgi:pimeloyl-CoA synthetase
LKRLKDEPINEGKKIVYVSRKLQLEDYIKHIEKIAKVRQAE